MKKKEYKLHVKNVNNMTCREDAARYLYDLAKNCGKKNDKLGMLWCFCQIAWIMPWFFGGGS